MYCFKKEKTYLELFNETTKRSYDKIGSKKYIFWFIIYLIAVAVQIIPTFIITFITGIVFAIIALATGAISNILTIESSPFFQWISLIISTGAVIFSFFIYIKFIEKRPFASIGLRSNKKLKKYLIGSLVAIAMQLFYFIVVLLFGLAEIVSEPIHATAGFGTSAISLVFLFLIGFMIQGASEEVVVRGWMMPVLSKHYKVSTAIILSSAFFGFLHILNPNISLLSIVNLILYGVFAALYALNDQCLWGIFAQHSIWNWFMGNVLGLPVSGMIMGKASIIETRLTGPAWITGGAFGPEGGIIVTFILSVSIFILIRLLIKKGILSKQNHHLEIGQ
ncbi:hypothetical protein DW1_0940 [Proteiniborus sp. DW1]|uniref:CPBP family intramembrane glutamic endopeptidase n=1 Tax=Proteiniborus sp. DW1 TaxID=1889883 RepID=UPI00092DEA9C|nr:type II CAAX endopeptidase family protein [Proteiniborus sp. DW1]SCG82547.1 hypothetical protein DW1_0940 [Proteiniborus sp. DW1]